MRSATATVTPLADGGLRAEVSIPVASGSGAFTLTVEVTRDTDGDWVVFHPIPDGHPEDVDYTIDGHGSGANGVLYLASPEDA